MNQYVVMPHQAGAMAYRIVRVFFVQLAVFLSVALMLANAREAHAFLSSLPAATPCPIPDPPPASPENPAQDNSFRNICLKGTAKLDDPTLPVLGSKPPFCMPAKTTTNIAPILSMRYRYLQSPDPVGIYRTEEDTSRTAGEASESFKRQDSMFNPSTGCAVPEPVLQAFPRLARLAYNQCANHFILGRRNNPLVPWHFFDVAGAPANLNQDFCQNLRLVPLIGPEFFEYDVAYYLRRAAIKLAIFPVSLPKKLFVGFLATPQLKGQAYAPPAENVQFERIYDPSHPYSPRFDFVTNERTFYSRFTAGYGYGGSVPSCAVACAAVPTDILRFRAAKFHARIIRRIKFNLDVCAANPICCGKNRPCSTRLKTVRTQPPFGSGYNPNADYEPDDPNPKCPKCPGTEIADICHDLGKPLPGINTLKLRSNDKRWLLPGPDGVPRPVNFPEGAPEGYTFKEFFANHRPYMRWWDTGGEAGQLAPVQRRPNYFSTYGSLDSIVGVGREGTFVTPPNLFELKRLGQTCRYGGDGVPLPLREFGAISVGGKVIPVTNPNTGWAEMKLYQARTLHRFGVNCIGRYEKLFKSYSAEDMVLGRAGAEYLKSKALITKDPRDVTALISYPFPLSWRGYISDPYPIQKFPSLFYYLFSKTGGGGVGGGMDYAKPGDIIIYDQGPLGTLGSLFSSRLPHVAYVTEAYNKAVSPANKTGPSYVKVVDFNHGKFPDACGNTDALGFGPERTIYRGVLDTHNATLHLTKKVITSSCADPDLKACVESLPVWSTIKVYRPQNDVRSSILSGVIGAGTGGIGSIPGVGNIPGVGR